MKDRDFLYQLLLLYFSDCFTWKTKGFSYIINETFKGKFCKHEKLAPHELHGDIFYFFFTAKDLMLADS